MIAAHVVNEDAIREQLKEFLPKEVHNIARRALTRLAADLRDQIKSDAPVDEGTLWQAVTSRRERGSKMEAVAAVWITKGKSAQHDAWYWHFVEFGTLTQPARPFIVPAVERMRNAMPSELGAILFDEIAKQLEKRARARARSFR